MPATDRPPGRGETGGETRLQKSSVDDDAVGFQDLLVPAIDLEEAAASGAPAPNGGDANGPMKGPGQEVTQGDSPDPVGAEDIGKAGSGRLHANAHPGGCGKRVPLNVVDREPEPAQIVRSPNFPIRFVAAAVDPSEDRFQIRSRRHRW